MIGNIIKIQVDDLKDFNKDMAKVNHLIFKDGFELVNITSTIVGADQKWVRHFFWLSEPFIK